MNCLKCGAERSILRDDEDNFYRRLCSCEVKETCYACARGKVVSALLTRAGEVSKYACAKHGNESTAEWLSLTDMPNAKPEKPAKSPRAKAVETSNDVKKTNIPIAHGTCCGQLVVTTASSFFCPACGKKVASTPVANGCIDGFYLSHGNDVTSVIIMMKIHGHGEYNARHFVVSVP